MLQLCFVRHGETDWNRQGRIQGRTDVPLNDTGRAQARELASTLSFEHWHGVVSSPLLRADETAQIVARELRLPDPRHLAELAERGYGEAEGTPWANFDERFDGAPPNGMEPASGVVERVVRGLELLDGEQPGATLIIVTHHEILRVVSHLASRAPSAEALENGSSLLMSFDAGGLRYRESRDSRDLADSHGVAGSSQPE